MIFKSESDVRVWVRIQSNGRARWIEHAAGGTPGLPDCWVPHGPHQVHLELKLADLNKAGQLRFTVRPQQRLEIMRMMHDAVPVGLLVGVKGTSVLLFVPPTRKGALRRQPLTTSGAVLSSSTPTPMELPHWWSWNFPTPELPHP
jgi:hypothetical protein